jgi:plasmid stabilization system protein ParE
VSLRLILRPSAQRDVSEAARYYFEQGGAGEAGFALASRFLRAVGAAIAIVREAPLAWPLITPSKRRYLVSLHDRFPFVVYYSVTEEEIVVVAILHGSRSPAIWRSRR